MATISVLWLDFAENACTVGHVGGYGTHPLLIHLPAEQSRRALSIVNQPGSPYASLSEFIVVAVENQLGLEEAAPDSAPEISSRPVTARASTKSGAPAKRSSAVRASSRVEPKPVPPSAETASDLLRRADPGELETRPPNPPGAHPLSPFTNRINPLVAGPRTLVSMMVRGGAPTVERFLEEAAAAARIHGLRLRAADEQAGRRGRHRRWTAWPVGDEEAKSLIRFRKSFLLWSERDGVGGPLVEFGLVAADGGLIYPTPAAVRLATGAIPVLDDDSDDVLLEPQRTVMAERLISLPGERTEIIAFLEAVDATGGAQDEVDKHVGHRHPHWTDAQLVSNRAAMIGRLRDLLVVDVDPQPGAKTTIVPGPAHQSFRQMLANASEATIAAATD